MYRSLLHLTVQSILVKRIEATYLVSMIEKVNLNLCKCLEAHTITLWLKYSDIFKWKPEKCRLIKPRVNVVKVIATAINVYRKFPARYNRSS